MGRCNRTAPGKFTRETSQETFNSPATQASTSRLDSMVRTRSPLGSTFSLSAERCELWMTWPVASAVVGVVFVFMTGSVQAAAPGVTANKSANLASRTIE